MFETLMTVIGNVGKRPSRRTLHPSGTQLAEFTLISHSRRFDRKLDAWTEGDKLAVRVTCWRDLADRVFESVSLGDPLIVHGRFSSYPSTDPVTGAKQERYNLEARAVGHNLNFGFGTFERANRDRTYASTIATPTPAELDRLVLDGFNLPQPEQVGEVREEVTAA